MANDSSDTGSLQSRRPPPSVHGAARRGRTADEATANNSTTNQFPRLFVVALVDIESIKLFGSHLRNGTMSDRCGTATRRRIAGIMAVACLVAVAIIASAADRPAAALDATTTPEAVLVDRERRIRYAGRIDDRYKIHGVMTPGDAEPESRNATEELLAGRAIREPRTKPAGCPLNRPERPTQSSPVAAGAPTFHTNVVPFLHTHCQICHAPGQAGPFNLLTYDDAVEWMELGLEELDARRMPPAQIASDLDYAGPKSPTAAEIAMLRAWVKAGKPEGNPAEAPQLDARARAGERGAIGGHAPPARGAALGHAADPVRGHAHPGQGRGAQAARDALCAALLGVPRLPQRGGRRADLLAKPRGVRPGVMDPVSRPRRADPGGDRGDDHDSPLAGSGGAGPQPQRLT
jgi:hypothetical protein